jgi:hypothetical protein
MKRIFIMCIALFAALTSFSQKEQDTIKVGGITIIRKPGAKGKVYKMPERRKSKNSNIRTNWWIVDLGFANYNDKTNYSSPAAQQYAPGSNDSWFALRGSKSVDVNLWFFMQRLNISKHVLNLQYGLGLELNNYRYKQPIRYDANPPAVSNPPIVALDNTPNRNYKKDKLAADYLTAPVMLNVNFTPNRIGRNSFGLSAGVSVGWLYSARNKTITSDEGKKKAKDDFDLERWKISYVGELTLGPVKLFGSMATKSMYSRGLDITPYNFGIRFSNW